MSTQPDYEHVLARAEQFLDENTNTDEIAFTPNFVLGVLVAEFPWISPNEYSYLLKQITLIIQQNNPEEEHDHSQRSLEDDYVDEGLGQEVIRFFSYRNPPEQLVVRVNQIISGSDKLQFLIHLKKMIRERPLGSPTIDIHEILSARVERLEEKIAIFDKFITEIDELNEKVTGDQRSAIYKQLFPDDNQIRKQIQRLIDGVIKGKTKFVNTIELFRDVEQIHLLSDLHTLIPKLSSHPHVRVYQKLLQRIEELQTGQRLANEFSAALEANQTHS